MSRKPGYLNHVPNGYTGRRCEYVARSKPCGLPAWDDAEDAEPRCYFHSHNKPDDIKKCLESAVADGARLWGADLTGARLFGADLTRASLREANLTGAILWEADLTGASLQGANLTGANLAAANLTRAILSHADLTGAYLWGANLTDASLRGANLTGARLQGANLTGADLRHAKLRSIWRLRKGADGPMGASETPPSLGGADLRGALLEGITIAPETDLFGTKFGPFPSAPVDPQGRIFEEIAATKRYVVGDELPTFEACAAVYRQLKLWYQHHGDYERAGIFFFREMHCLRMEVKQKGWWRWEHIKRWVYEVLAGYGESPGRVAIWILLVILLLGALQGFIGIPGVSGGGVDWRPTWEGFGRFLSACYFSLITFTTTGYGDLRPAPVWGRLCAGIEAILGMALMSLFLVCVVRKFSR